MVEVSLFHTDMIGISLPNRTDILANNYSVLRAKSRNCLSLCHCYWPLTLSSWLFPGCVLTYSTWPDVQNGCAWFILYSSGFQQLDDFLFLRRTECHQAVFLHWWRGNTGKDCFLCTAFIKWRLGEITHEYNFMFLIDSVIRNLFSTSFWISWPYVLSYSSAWQSLASAVFSILGWRLARSSIMFIHIRWLEECETYSSVTFSEESPSIRELKIFSLCIRLTSLPWNPYLQITHSYTATQALFLL